MEHDAFISYSSVETSTADAICHRLEAAGIRCWVAPRNVQPGRSWAAQIDDAIRRSALFILVFSENSNRSEPVKSELDRAAHYVRAIIPFRIELILDIDPEIAFHIGRVHWLDAMTPPLEGRIDELVERARALLAIPSAQAAHIGPDPSTYLPPPRRISVIAPRGGSFDEGQRVVFEYLQPGAADAVPELLIQDRSGVQFPAKLYGELITTTDSTSGTFQVPAPLTSGDDFRLVVRAFDVEGSRHVGYSEPFALLRSVDRKLSFAISDGVESLNNFSAKRFYEPREHVIMALYNLPDWFEFDGVSIDLVSLDGQRRHLGIEISPFVPDWAKGRGKKSVTLTFTTPTDVSYGHTYTLRVLLKDRIGVVYTGTTSLKFYTRGSGCRRAIIMWVGSPVLFFSFGALFSSIFPGFDGIIFFLGIPFAGLTAFGLSRYLEDHPPTWFTKIR